MGQEITNSIDFIGYYLRNHKIEVITLFADPLPNIYADRQQLRQVFLGLLTNGSDAMLNGGQLTVTATVRELDPCTVEIRFKDTCEGISVPNLEKIWEPFFTRKGEGKGTGLAMGICRRIVEEHSGTVAIDSEGGLGKTITIRLPTRNAGLTSRLR